ncbi:hypothetical protein GCM10009783_51560 [Glycomyces lechevalierae]
MSCLQIRDFPGPFPPARGRTASLCRGNCAGEREAQAPLGRNMVDLRLQYPIEKVTDSSQTGSGVVTTSAITPVTAIVCNSDHANLHIFAACPLERN